MGPWSWLALGCCMLLSLQQGLCFPWCKAFADNRRQLADYSAPDQSPNIVTDGNWTIVFQQVTSTRGAMINLLPDPMAAPFAVSSMSASMEMSSNATYQSGFDVSNRTTWALGFTRVNVSIDISLTNSTIPPASVTLMVHTIPCSADAALALSESNVYFQIPDQPQTAMVTPLPISDLHGEGSALFPYQIDYDNARSIVAYSGGPLSGTNEPQIPLACSNLIPPFPEFPNVWSATIEANIVEKGYTFVMREYYSQPDSMVRLDMHSQATERIVLQNFTSQMYTLITSANETYPHGVCETHPMDNQPGLMNRMYSSSSNAILSTAEFLHFAGAVNGFRPGHENVRGIHCEIWGQTMNFGDQNATFDVNYYFPVNQWMVAREDYHRMLKRIRVNGTRDGRPLDHYYEFVNMRPRQLQPKIFDICAIAPLGVNCNCTGPAEAAVDIDGVDIDPTNDNTTEFISRDQPQSRMTSGFTSAQKMPYAVLFFSGLAAGLLLTVACIGLYFLVVPRALERLNHARFEEMKRTWSAEPSSIPQPR